MKSKRSKTHDIKKWFREGLSCIWKGQQKHESR